MTLESIIIFLAIGAIAGWLAGVIVKGGGYGLLGDIVLGIVGSVIGGIVFNSLGIFTYSILGTIIASTVGAVILITILRLIKRA